MSSFMQFTRRAMMACALSAVAIAAIGGMSAAPFCDSPGLITQLLSAPPPQRAEFKGWRTG